LHRVGTSNYITPITQAINDLLMFSWSNDLENSQISESLQILLEQ
jgi:hypothetical protein